MLIRGRASGIREESGVGVYFWSEQRFFGTVSNAKGVYRIELPAGEYIALCWGKAGNLLEGKLEHPSNPCIIKVTGGMTTKEDLTAQIMFVD